MEVYLNGELVHKTGGAFDNFIYVPIKEELN